MQLPICVGACLFILGSCLWWWGSYRLFFENGSGLVFFFCYFGGALLIFASEAILIPFIVHG